MIEIFLSDPLEVNYFITGAYHIKIEQEEYDKYHLPEENMRILLSLEERCLDIVNRYSKGEKIREFYLNPSEANTFLYALKICCNHLNYKDRPAAASFRDYIGSQING